MSMRHFPMLRRVVLIVVCLVVVSGALLAQRGGGRGGPSALSRTLGVNPPYDGRFTFTRVSYNRGSGLAGGFSRRGGMSQAWNHDYPRADLNLALILEAITAIQPNLDATNILSLEDPEIFKNPVLYMWEPGYWRITDAEAENLRKYLLKGGFIIFDDFEVDHLDNLKEQFRRAMPHAEFIKLDTSHRIFHTFFEMNSINVPHPTMNVQPAYYAVFEDNDPTRRILALANHNSDIAEYWEWSGQGFLPVYTTNDAYKLGVNYIIYALTH